MAKPGITPTASMRVKPSTRKISMKSAVHHIAGPEQEYPVYRFSGRYFTERPNHKALQGWILPASGDVVMDLVNTGNLSLFDVTGAVGGENLPGVAPPSTGKNATLHASGSPILDPVSSQEGAGSTAKNATLHASGSPSMDPVSASGTATNADPDTKQVTVGEISGIQWGWYLFGDPSGAIDDPLIAVEGGNTYISRLTAVANFNFAHEFWISHSSFIDGADELSEIQESTFSALEIATSGGQFTLDFRPQGSGGDLYQTAYGTNGIFRAVVPQSIWALVDVGQVYSVRFVR